MHRANSIHIPPRIAIHDRLSALLLTALVACEAEPDDREQFRGSCEQIFACGCLVDPYNDIDECMRDAAAFRAGWLAEAAAAGLTPDTACMDRWQAPDPDMCLTWHEYEVLHPIDEIFGGTECGVCSVASGARQIGEVCTQFSRYGRASDCAPGLLCEGVCIDPCVPTSAGLPCENGVNECGEGLHCSVDRVCVPVAGPGESCAHKSCAVHHICDDELDRCVRLPADGEPCLGAFCDWEYGLTCLPTGVCGEPPKRGEPCLYGCADDLNCHPFDHVCAPRGQAGDGCVSDLDCAPEVYCSDNLCITGGDLGERCGGIWDPCRIGLSCIDDECGPGQGLICGEV